MKFIHIETLFIDKKIQCNKLVKEYNSELVVTYQHGWYQWRVRIFLKEDQNFITYIVYFSSKGIRMNSFLLCGSAALWYTNGGMIEIFLFLIKGLNLNY